MKFALSNFISATAYAHFLILKKKLISFFSDCIIRVYSLYHLVFCLIIIKNRNDLQNYE